MWDVWCLVLSYGGPLSLLPRPYRAYGAVLRIQRAVRGYLRRVPDLATVVPPRCVKIHHGGTWKTGTLDRFEQCWFVTVEGEAAQGRRWYVFITPREWHMVLA